MLDKAKILVVDDTPANLEVITETLTLEGCQVAIAISGDRALRRLQTYHPDLILLDVQMPGIDGFETCRQIKANPDLAQIPILFITALSDIESIMQGFSLGAVDYIIKPFREPELLARVKTHLQLRQMTQHLEQMIAERTQALESALAELRSSQLQLVQQEKMSSLGNLVAGVAHEINNPIGFVENNTKELQRNLADILEHLSLYQQQANTEEIEKHAKEIDLSFLMEDMPKMLVSMLAGCDRITSISTSLRTFSRADTEHKVSANLHAGLDSTLLILKYRLKASQLRPAIEIIQEYGELPLIECFPGQLNQVFMNILANAIDMFDEVAQTQSFEQLKTNPQKITICTQKLGQEVLISIRDNGKGMDETTQVRIFDHLFTTKAADKGTGLGLAIAKQIVEEKHGGRLEVKSQLGQGTEFAIVLPICG